MILDRSHDTLHLVLTEKENEKALAALEDVGQITLSHLTIFKTGVIQEPPQEPAGKPARG